MKLFTIGDSLGQGYTNLACARTDLCYSTLIAKQMGLKDYHYPEWPAGGMPGNLELIFRKLYDPRKNIKWYHKLATFVKRYNKVVADAKQYYETGKGNITTPYPGGKEYFHNVSLWGFTVADSWKLNAEKSIKGIEEKEKEKRIIDKARVIAPFYRTIVTVLNPSRKKEYMKYTQLDWLKHHSSTEGVENFLLELGTNNALRSITRLIIKESPGAIEGTQKKNFNERLQWTLWRSRDFAKEYAELIARVDKIMEKNTAENWKVFVANVPLVTLFPFIKGQGKKHYTKKGVYYDYYTYFPYDNKKEAGQFLTKEQAQHIDNTIEEYNKHINKILARKNKKHKKKRYYLVDLARFVSEAAYKRNNGEPKYVFPKTLLEELKKKKLTISSEAYDVDKKGKFIKGGIISLDGVHPHALGQGLTAHEFLKVMKRARVPMKNGYTLPWKEILKSDTLISEPINMVREIIKYKKLAGYVIKTAAAREGQ